MRFRKKFSRIWFTLRKCWDHHSTTLVLNVSQWSGLWVGLWTLLTQLAWKLVLRGAKTVERLLEEGVRRELTVNAVRFLRGRILSVSCKRTLGLGRSRCVEFAVANVTTTQPSHTRWEGYLYSTVGKGERSCLGALTYRHEERRPYHFSLRPISDIKVKVCMWTHTIHIYITLAESVRCLSFFVYQRKKSYQNSNFDFCLKLQRDLWIRHNL